MRIAGAALLLAAVIFGGCANPLNQVTSDRYSEQCAEAEAFGDLALAEVNCGRALTNVYWGNLGPEEESKKLYNLARIKGRMGKHVEAEDLLKKSLAIEETLSPPTDPKIGRRLVELVGNLAEQTKWEEAAAALKRVIPIGQRFSGRERQSVVNAFEIFGQKMREMNRGALAERFEKASAALK